MTFIQKTEISRSQRRNSQTIIAIADTYLPFWFAEVLPELEKPDFDIYQLIRQLGKKPYWCTETVDVVKATSADCVLFELSPDEPADLFKILRKAFDHKGRQRGSVYSRKDVEEAISQSREEDEQKQKIQLTTKVDWMRPSDLPATLKLDSEGVSRAY